MPVSPPSQIRAVRKDDNRQRRTRQMADVMLHHAHGPDSACTIVDLKAAGFTQAEIEALADDARRLNRATPPVVLAPNYAKREGQRLVRMARRVRARMQESGHRVG